MLLDQEASGLEEKKKLLLKYAKHTVKNSLYSLRQMEKYGYITNVTNYLHK